MRSRSESVTAGVAVVLPALDAGWFGPGGSGRSILLLVGLALVAIVALLVAGAAHHSDAQRKRRSIDDEELFTTTPLPMPREELERMAKNPPDRAFQSHRLPRWVQAGSVVVALVMTLVVADRMRPAREAPRRDSPPRDLVGAADRPRQLADGPEDLDLTPDSAPPFTFRARDWVERDGGCTGVLEATEAEPAEYNLMARVHDNRGQLLDTARAHVATLMPGDVVEFRFARATCDQIGAWDVRGRKR